jgi:cytidylate kinase
MDSPTSLKQLGHAIAHLYRQRQPDPQVPNQLDKGPPRFTVAIARETGTDGAALARTVGRRLDWPVFDNELLDIIAKEMRLRRNQLEDIDERPLSWFLESVEAFTTDHFVSENAYLKYLVQTMATLGKNGHSVVVGRGAAHILPPDTTLRVRLVAPRKKRVEMMRQRYDLSAKEAEQKVDHTDRDRSQFVQQHFNRNANDPANYDLVLNSARFSLADCAELIITGLRALESRLEKKAAQIDGKQESV